MRHVANSPVRRSLLFRTALLLTIAGLSVAALASRRAAASDELVSEKFSGSKLPAGWKIDRTGVWSIRSGHLRAVLPNKKQEKSFLRIGSKDWKNYAVEVDVCQVRGVDKGLAVRIDDDEGVGIDLRGGDLGDIVMYRNFTQLGKAAAPNVANKWYKLRVEVKGARYRVFVDGAPKIDHVDKENQRPSGGIALSAYTGGSGECEVLFDNLVVSRLP